MKTLSSQSARFWVIALVGLACSLSAADSPREHLSLDKNWRFQLGKKENMDRGRGGTGNGPAAQKFNDSGWRAVDLPHDWTAESWINERDSGKYSTANNGSIGWYRRTFELPQGDAGKRIWLQFDGVMHDATVWVNGWLVQRHFGGYEQFRADVTELVHFGGGNTLSVRVDADSTEGWWVEGAGIYRHVWLDKTAALSVAPDGIFVHSQFKNNIPDGRVEVAVETRLLNKEATSAKAAVLQEVVSSEGRSVAKAEQTVEATGSDLSEVKGSLFFNDPVLWSPESPKLYKLITTVQINGRVVDARETEFGIRTMTFDKDQGFVLNGKHYELYGTCNHQDHAGVGAAIPDALQYFRVAKLKEFGCNAYRTSHHPPTPELLDACDRLGMIVMDESRLLGCDEDNLHKLESLVRRDRSRACVGFWSLCNEEPLQSTEEGGRVAAKMQSVLKRLDPTRAVTAAANVGNDYNGVMKAVEVRGWNYCTSDDYHKSHPEQPNVGTETASYVSDRGRYENDKDKGYVTAFTTDPGLRPITSHWWTYYATRPWMSGGFIWTGFDYRGEPTPYNWPINVSSHFGVLDTCGFAKDEFYYYQAWWTTNTVLHLLPHWNWAGKEGQEIQVNALSNCEEVELFLNGQSQGRKPMERTSRLSWKVNYAPGTLSAKGFNGGKQVAETKVETTGAATAIRLTPNRSTLNADGTDVSVITVAVVDAQGRIVPTAGNKIRFKLSGAGKILGVGNGDPACHEPDRFVAAAPVVRRLPAKDWSWKIVKGQPDGARPTLNPDDLGDAGWKPIALAKELDKPVAWGQTVLLKARVTLTGEDLANPAVQVSFEGLPEHGGLFVNQTYLGETSKKWSGPAAFEAKQQLQVGENRLILRGAKLNPQSGLEKEPTAQVELIKNAPEPDWSRSVFSGLSQIIVQSTPAAGHIKLAASADGLNSVTTTITTQSKLVE